MECGYVFTKEVKQKMDKQGGRLVATKNLIPANQYGSVYMLVPRWWLTANGLEAKDPVDLFLTGSGGLLIKPSKAKESEQ